MISVVIPVYNKAKYIANTISSVLSQTFSNFELIVVNDGSTDNSMREVDGFTDDRLRLVSIENSGVSVARNTGIENAAYPWVAFLDADDWWAPNFLEETAAAIKIYPKHKLFATGRSRIFKTETERYDHPYLPENESTAPVNYYKVISKYLPLINSSNVVIYKSLFETAGFFKEGQKQHEDHDLWVRLAVDEEVIFVNKNLSFYRKIENDTASVAPFQANDFCNYLSTMIAVRKKITRREQHYFKQYYNKFIVLAYVQNYGQYTKEEGKKVFALVRQLLEGRSLWLAKTVKFLPLKRAYPLYKKMKGK